MNNQSTLFFHSEEADPFSRYEHQRLQQPLFWDEQDQIWAAYSYEICQQLLIHPAVHVPNGVTGEMTGLSNLATTLRSNLARLSNPPLHGQARQLASGLFNTMQPVSMAKLLARLLSSSNKTGKLDWVEVVAKKLPVLAVLAGLEFSLVDIVLVLERISVLPRLMLPQASEDECRAINEAVARLYPVIEQHIRNKPELSVLLESLPDQTDVLPLVSNLMGLLIQSADAGRGLLTNALVQTLSQSPKPTEKRSDLSYLRRNVLETLRFDPPIHNTRRIMAQDAEVGRASLRKGQSVLLVLAAANRDSSRFVCPHQFNPERSTNAELLTFGTGIHSCIARHLVAEQTAQALAWLFSTYPQVQLFDKSSRYEPLINARLRKQLRIILH
jgi:cytochrome P450